jgi:hypothetical protein
MAWPLGLRPLSWTTLPNTVSFASSDLAGASGSLLTSHQFIDSLARYPELFRCLAGAMLGDGLPKRRKIGDVCALELGGGPVTSLRRLGQLVQRIRR